MSFRYDFSDLHGGTKPRSTGTQGQRRSDQPSANLIKTVTKP
jgi:hypothetical protein